MVFMISLVISNKLLAVALVALPVALPKLGTLRYHSGDEDDNGCYWSSRGVSGREGGF